MKRIIPIFLLLISATIVRAQVPMSVFTPADGNSTYQEGDMMSRFQPYTGRRQQSYQNRRQRPQYTRTTGYYIENNRFKRISIKIYTMETSYGESVYLKGVMGFNGWSSCNTNAYPINAADPDYLKENFSWKVPYGYVPGGYIYFNY